MKKKLVILGSSGSIGKNTLNVVRQNPNKFEVLAISAGKNVHEFITQILEFKPKYAIMQDHILLASVKTKTSHVGAKYLSGKECFQTLASEVEDFDCLVSAISGIAGMEPTFSLLSKCKILAIANKESVICAGKFLINEAKKHNVEIIPIDSEHNSAYRLMQGINRSDVKRLTITASGGMFFGKQHSELKNVSIDQVNSHPNWAMGQKNTIDSNTMANKALELMEAGVLFDLKYHQLDAMIHTKSIVHALLETEDNGVMAFLGRTGQAVADASIGTIRYVFNLLRNALEQLAKQALQKAQSL